jgi:hypothetical protein
MARFGVDQFVSRPRRGRGDEYRPGCPAKSPGLDRPGTLMGGAKKVKGRARTGSHRQSRRTSGRRSVERIGACSDARADCEGASAATRPADDWRGGHRERPVPLSKIADQLRTDPILRPGKAAE